jgi:hypothetical protein
VKFRGGMEEAEKDEGEEKIEVAEVELGNENANAEGNEREVWKVMGFGLAWFWLLTSST